MAKIKTAYICQKCGSQSSKWLGQCSNCKEWNTFIEEVIEKKTTNNAVKLSYGEENNSILFEDIKINKTKRIEIEDTELNRVLGKGIVGGAVVLLGGEPGIGKSTLLLQLALKNTEIKTLYISGEESEGQIKMRGDRVGVKNPNCYVLTETNTQNILKEVKKIKPDLIIIDSIQTIQTNNIESSAGSISQIRESASEFIDLSKYSNIPIFLVGHITKDGNIAGPKVLEHMVDVVLHFEGDRNHIFRILRANKNRFGSTQEIGIYQMKAEGLEVVKNPSEVFISNLQNGLSGNSIAVSLEGIRPILIEVQALVSPAVYGTPQRSTTGYNIKRLNMLLAVLEKRLGFQLSSKDVFLNIVGGIKIEDPALDLSVIASILSSNEDINISNKYCFSAEVGLSGEIRPITRIESRILEAEKLGFEKIFISSANKINKNKYQIEIIQTSKIIDFFKSLMS